MRIKRRLRWVRWCPSTNAQEGTGPQLVPALPIFPDSGTLLEDLILMCPEIIPERKLPTLKRSDRIDGASFLGPFQEQAFKIVFSKPFLDRQSIAHPVKVFLDAINGICLQEGANLEKFLLMYPNTTGWAAAAAARAVSTCAGVKGEIKSGPAYDTHGLLPFCQDNKNLTSPFLSACPL